MPTIRKYLLMNILREFNIKFFAIALLVLIMTEGCQSHPADPQQQIETDTPKPTVTSTSEPLLTLTIEATPTEHSAEYDYTDLPSLGSLIASKDLISDSIYPIPSLLFNPNLIIKPADIDLIDDCGIECINLEYLLPDQSLIISLVKYQSENEAQNQIDYLWNEISPEIPTIFIYDDYEGIGDDVWAAQEFTTLYMIRREGPIVIFMSHFIELPEGAVDFEGNHFMGLLSCLGNIQAKILQIASTGSTPYIDQEPESCMEWLW
jgi:hypothetical protein